MFTKSWKCHASIYAFPHFFHQAIHKMPKVMFLDACLVSPVDSSRHASRKFVFAIL